MDALVITLREGIEAALVIGIIYALVKRYGRPELMRWVYAGVASAVAFSLAGAVALRALGVDAQSETVEGITYLIASVAVASMVVWMWRHGRQIRSKVESRVTGMIGEGSPSTAAGLGLFAFSFFMIAREGIETVLFLSASALSGESQAGLALGAVAGFTLSVVYGILFARGALRIDLKLFFTLTSIVLGLLAVKLFGGAMHEFEEAGVLAMSETAAEAFDWLAETAVIDWLFLAALVVPFVAPYVKRGASGRPTGSLPAPTGR
jgi:FTR1 family protein